MKTEQCERSLRWAYIEKMKSDTDRSHPHLVFATGLISSISLLFEFCLSLAFFSKERIENQTIWHVSHSDHMF